MEDHKILLLGQGALLLGHGVFIIGYFLLRKKARELSPDRSILLLGWWKSVLRFLCVVLLGGALAWTISNAVDFARLTSNMKTICLTHLTDEACARAIPQWKSLCSTSIEVSVLALFILLVSIYGEAKMTEAPPERAYPLAHLTWSYGMLLTSWMLETPLKYSLKAFSLQGTDQWTHSVYTFALVAILAYVLGSTLWITAVMRVFFAWLRKRIVRSPGEERRDRGRDFVLQDMYP